jgi:hypothetical protein
MSPGRPNGSRSRRRRVDPVGQAWAAARRLRASPEAAVVPGPSVLVICWPAVPAGQQAAPSIAHRTGLRSRPHRYRRSACPARSGTQQTCSPSIGRPTQGSWSGDERCGAVENPVHRRRPHRAARRRLGAGRRCRPALTPRARPHQDAWPYTFTATPAGGQLPPATRPPRLPTTPTAAELTSSRVCANRIPSHDWPVESSPGCAGRTSCCPRPWRSNCGS